MAVITGYSRGTWSEGPYGAAIPVQPTGVSASGVIDASTVTVITTVLFVPTGITGTGQLGDESIMSENYIPVTGVSASGNTGTPTIVEGQGVDAPVTGVSGSGMISTAILWGLVDETSSPTWTEVSDVSDTWSEVSNSSGSWTEKVT